jgi:hypothetical protein
MKIKFGIISIMTCSALLTLPLLTSAKSLTLTNATKKSFTVRVNKKCASEFGVMKANSSKTVTEEALNQLCERKLSNCEAIIFKSNDCTGQQIADVLFDTNTGVKGSFRSAKNYTITVSFPLNWVTLSEAL